ncbi:MAG: glycine--tRNA ligase subunit alpha, partial [Chlamydiales bacterium]|nr:glycine--tRNA ligase subunit alpha [Chlamydiales bacterium]
MSTFQEMVSKLASFWEKQGCAISSPYDLEKGAGTSNPATFFRCLGPEPYRAAYIEPCRRPKDGRYGTNPMRMQHYFQYQVILKPSPVDIQDLYLKSLEAIGFDLSQYDIRFVHDDWEQPTLGAWGLGWEVWVDGMESSQFTYFQAMAEIPLKPVTGELTYGLERLAMHLQKKDNFADIKWNDELTYGDMYLENEKQWTEFNFEHVNPEMMLKNFEEYKAEAKKLVSLGLPQPAYDFVLKSSHTFNLLDARGVISVSERASYIAAIRELARLVAESYIDTRKKANYPLQGKWAGFAYKQPPAKTIDAYKPIDKQTTTFLLEVGSEELPATFVMSGLASLERQLKSVLEKEGLTFGQVNTYGTPRRLAILVQDLTVKTASKDVEKKGPSVEASFDAQGNPTQIGMGFFKSMGLESVTLDAIRQGKVPQIEIRTLKGDYLFGIQKVGCQEAYDILQKSLASIITGIEFPKKMRWADFDITYARPIRWIVALLDNQVIPCTVGPITSGNTSVGHRQLSGGTFAINNASDYVETLRKHNVIVDPKERQKDILEQLAALEKNGQGIAQVKERVTNEVMHLVEKPFLTLGESDSEFLKAPKEVLISEMVEHQKYFPFANADGTLKNKFIITANVPPTDSIRHGNRKVLSARLSDGVFLFGEDLKQPLEQ